MLVWKAVKGELYYVLKYIIKLHRLKQYATNPNDDYSQNRQRHEYSPEGEH